MYRARTGAIVASRGDGQRPLPESNLRHLLVCWAEPLLVQSNRSSKRHADDLASVGDRPLHARDNPGGSAAALVA